MTSTTSVFAVSPFDRTIGSGDDQRLLWQVELRDLARGFVGALLLALPLLFTLEMWQRARVIPAWDMALILLVAYFGNVGFATFSSFKPELRRRAPWLDALTAMGIGLVASVITLVLINQLNATVPADTAVKLVLLEMVPTSFGASLAMNQLRDPEQSKNSKELEDTLGNDAKTILGTVLGALIFSFNIAPTVETQIIGNALTPWHIGALVAFSLAVSYVLVFFAGFLDRGPREGVLGRRWVETVVSYLVSLAVSAFLLWTFGYIDFGTPLGLVVPWVVTMGYATTLTGAAGRLVL